MRAARSWAVRLDGSLRFSGRSAAQWVRIRARRGSRGCPGEARNGRWFGRAAGGKRVRIGHKIDMEDICAGEWCTVAMATRKGPARYGYSEERPRPGSASSAGADLALAPRPTGVNSAGRRAGLRADHSGGAPGTAAKKRIFSNPENGSFRTQKRTARGEDSMSMPYGRCARVSQVIGCTLAPGLRKVGPWKVSVGGFVIVRRVTRPLASVGYPARHPLWWGACVRRSGQQADGLAAINENTFNVCGFV